LSLISFSFLILQINEKFGGVCRSLTQWVFRKFNDTKLSLSKGNLNLRDFDFVILFFSLVSYSLVIFKINHVMRMKSLCRYEAAFSAALAKVLALFDDRQILYE
jgi:hypothetical protein